MKFINSFNILKSDLQKTKSTRRFSINGKADAAFDLKVTNEGGKFYNFITQTFETNETISTTSVVSNDIEGSAVYINAANANIKLGMTVTGNGVSSVVTVVQINSQTLILSDSVDVSAGTTLTFTAEANLKNQKINKSGSYVNNIVFPTVTSNDIYTVLLEASVANDTELKTTENIVYDTDINSATYGQDITHEFTNKLFKSITINQYIDTTITINASSPALDALGVDYSSNSFTIVKPRNFQDLQGFKTSFTFTFTTTSVSAIVKSKDFEAKYFETVKTQTVNGAVSSSRTVVMDSVDNIIVGMKATGTGLSAAADKVIYIDALNKEITLNNARSIGDGVTITFTAEGSQGPSAYGTQLSFVNLKSTLTPLTVTVASASSSSTALALEDASFVSEGSSTIISGVGINVDETNVNVASRPSGDLEFTEGGGAYNNDPTITHTADARIVAGLAVSGSGIPAGATIASITDATHFELSVATTGGNKTGETLTFNSNNIVLSSARSLEAGQKLNIEGSSSAITLTGDVFLKSIGDTNFTSTLQIDDFVGIGVS
tara:strand:+ start:1148 stop:2797 length:1650 start_codon:yes stop_codon:yes gene_type:complete